MSHPGALCPSCQGALPLGARFCSACGVRSGDDPAPTARHADADVAGGERRQLTVLVCDLVGATEPSARLDSADRRESLRVYRTHAREVVARHGGQVAQDIGDGLFAYFGWSGSHDDAAEQAVRAALGLIDATATVGAGGTVPAARVGLHTGPVVVSNLGVRGEVPDLAARVLAAAEPGTVVLTAATQRLVAGVFVVEERGAQCLEGVAQPVVLYRVIQPGGVPSRLEALLGRRAPFVGRQTELGRLRDAWERVVEGTGQIVLVQGEAGLGKSRLCYQLREQLTGEPHTWLECRASPYTAGTAFRPVTELVGQALAFEATDTPADKLGKLGLGLARAGLAGGEPRVLLAELLGLSEDAPRQMSPELKRRRTLETLAAWTLRLAELQPMVLLVEDLHWCDPSSLELLGRLVEQSAAARLLLIGTARPDFASPWPARSNLQRLTLARLTQRQAREMIGAISAPRSLPETVVAHLVERVDGVPLYAEQLTQAVIEAGGDASVAAIPESLQDSLLARLDRLSSAKEVAQRAAVLGREFGYPLLAATAGLDEGALQQGLARLVEAELLFVRGEPPQATYTFKHALVQEVAYGSLSDGTRRQLHGRVVDVLGTQFPERAAAEPEVVARHAEAAGRIDDAIACYRRAGEHAHLRSAYEEAIRHLRHAIALLATRPEGAERDAEEVQLQLALGAPLTAVRGYSHDDVEAAYERARVLCDTVGDARQLGLTLIGLAIFYFTRGEAERGRTLAARVLAAAELSGDTELVLRGHLDVAMPEYYQGRFASSLAHCDAAGALYDPARHHAGVSVIAADPGVAALAFGAWNTWALGWPDRALTRVLEAIALARRLDHPFSLALALFHETVLHWLRRDSTAQRERAAELVAVSEALGFPLFLAVGRTFHAAARAAVGEPGAVADVLAGLALAAGTGTKAAVPALFALLGTTYMGAGQLDEARGALETGIALSRQTGQPLFDAELHRLQGELLLAAGAAPVDAEAAFRRAIDVTRPQEARSFELRAATSLARLWRGHRRCAEARDLLAPVSRWFTEGFDTRDLIEAKALLEELR